MELLLVIGILGILSVIGLSAFTSAVARGKDTRRKNDLSQLAKSLEAYMGDFGVYPDNDVSGRIVGCSPEGSSTPQACPVTAGGKFQRGRTTGSLIEKIVYLDKFPSDPDTSKKYYYENTGSPGFALYASLDNDQDKDVRSDVDGNPIAAGWDSEDDVDCGPKPCNYKLTQSGVVRQ